MAEPAAGEALGSFVSRAMGTKEPRRYTPKGKQRAAVALSEARKARLKK